jgi:hypothetical protein
MKNTFAVLFLTIMLYNIVGNYSLFLLERIKIKQEVKQRIKREIPQEELTVLTFDKQSYKKIDWVERNEFRYNGSLYDVVNNQIDSDGNVSIYVINDEKEKELYALFEQQVDENDSDTETNKNNTKLLELLSTVDLPVNNLNCFVPEKLVSIAFHKSTLYNTIVGEILSPPPRIA